MDFLQIKPKYPGRLSHVEGERHVNCILLNKSEAQKEDKKTAVRDSESRRAVIPTCMTWGAVFERMVDVSVRIFSTERFPKAQETLFVWNNLEAMPSATQVIMRKIQGISLALGILHN